MTSQWRTFEPREAEANYRGLQRRLVDLEEALAAQSKLSEFDPTSFAAQLSLQGLLSMQEALLTERAELLRDRNYELIKLSFEGKSFHREAANFEALGWFLVRFQKLLDAVGQAISSGPTRRGPIASDTRRLTELRFRDSFASSFGIEVSLVSNYDLFGESISVAAIRALFQILNSRERESAVRQQIGELGERTFRHFRRLLDDLVVSSDSVSMIWDDVGGTNYQWSDVSQNIASFSHHLHDLRSTIVHEFELDAYLGGVSLIRRRFEAVRLDSKEIIEGKISQQAFAQAKEAFAQTARIGVQEAQTENKLTGDTDRFYTLIYVKPLMTH